MNRAPNWQLGWVCVAVLFASSTWFAGAAAGPALVASWQLSPSASVWLTISVQLGFIVGTVAFAAANVADLWNARRVFAASAVGGALFNLGFALAADGFASAIVFRSLTGFTLAGVYPVAMKIIASWFRKGLGWRLGLMVGALTMGTALPYLSSAIGHEMSWRIVAASASAMAAIGGALMLLFVQDGPHLRAKAALDMRAFARVFRNRRFRLSAIGYFGHMWELYAVWALIAALFAEAGITSSTQLAGLSFAVVAIGSLGCICGGWLSTRLGERRIAQAALAASGALCLASPLLIEVGPALAIPAALFWGLVVVADSPQLSALAANNCPPEYTATALTIQNGIGFAITIGSLQLLPLLGETIGWKWAFLALAPGPAIGWLALYRLGKDDASSGPI